MSSSSPHFCDLLTFNTLALPCQAKNFVVLSDLGQLQGLSTLLKKCQKPVHDNEPTQSTQDNLTNLTNQANETNQPHQTNQPNLQMRWHILGGGSNLVLPKVLHQPVLHIQIKGIHLLDDQVLHNDQSITKADKSAYHRIRVAAGENWHDWVTFALNKGWYGLENLALIPGSVGAAPVQNIGAYGVEVAQFIESVDVWNIETEQFLTLSVQDCDFAYRNSRFKRAHYSNEIIVAVNFALPKAWQPVLTYPDLKPLAQRHLNPSESITPHDVYQLVCQVRQRKLPNPALIPNAGSFFQNPVVPDKQAQALKAQHPNLVCYPQADGTTKLAAGWLIDKCGWKGKRLGSVGMHANQALVLVNPDGGHYDDVMTLADAVRHDVQTLFGVALQIEPICWMPDSSTHHTG
jgi:UDP-N-acetylmuramate dehydrogenase